LTVNLWSNLFIFLVYLFVKFRSLYICTINPFKRSPSFLPSIPYLVPLQNNKKKLVPSPLRRKQFKRFFDCAGKLMESQLLRACKRSLRDFVNYVANGKVNIHICLPLPQSIECEIISRRGNTHAFGVSFLRLSAVARVIGTLLDTISINFCLSKLFKARSP